MSCLGIVFRSAFIMRKSGVGGWRILLLGRLRGLGCLGGLEIVGQFRRLGVVLCCVCVLQGIVRSCGWVHLLLLGVFWVFGCLKWGRALHSKSKSLERALLPRPAAYEAAALLD